MTAKKDDQQKPQANLILEFLDLNFLCEVGKVMEFGRKKYGKGNWRKGMQWSRLLAAVLRHLWKWSSGVTKDEETGLSHLAHATCSLMFLFVYEKEQLGENDIHE